MREISRQDSVKNDRNGPSQACGRYHTRVPTPPLLPTADLETVEHFFELAGDLFCIADHRGYFLRLNRAWESALGYSRHELTVRPFIDFVHPDDVEATGAAMQNLTAGKPVINFVNRYRHADGSWRHLRWNTTSPAGGMLFYAVASDITEEVRQRELAGRHEARFRSLFDHAAEPICIADAGNGQLLQVNRAFLDFLGYEAGEVIGRGAFDFHPEDIRDYQARRFREAATGKRVVLPDVPFLAKGGRLVHATISATPMALEGLSCIVGYLLDTTEQHEAAEQMRRQQEQYRAVIDASLDGFWMTDLEGRILEVNGYYVERSGYRREELLRMTINDLDAAESAEDTRRHIAELVPRGGALFETLHRTKEGVVWQAEINAAFWPAMGGRFFVFIRDINQRKRSEQLLRTRWRLLDIAEHGSIDNLLQATLDAAELFTGSNIGFFHFVDPDQENLHLQTWSTNTLKHMCTAEGKGAHYPVSEAGIWADCVRERRAVLVNDYPRHPAKHGMPDGHAPVSRVANVPVIQGGRIVAVIGVGNKLTDYTDEDVTLLTELATMAMEVVDRRRAEDHRKLTASVFESSRDAILITDPGWKIIAVNPAFTRITGYTAEEALGRRPSLLKPEQGSGPAIETIEAALQDSGFWQGEIVERTQEGREFPAWVSASAVHDDRGNLINYSTIITDLSQTREAERQLAYMAQFDALTGLPNRAQFELRGAQAIARAQRHPQTVAVLLLDVDRFKTINDSLGHPVGDALLREIAERLRPRLRSEDMLARMGGDEFGLLLDGVAHAEDAGLVARDVITAMSEPFRVDGHELSVGASVGIALYPDDGGDITTLMRDADAALFQAKEAGRGDYRFYTESLTASAVLKVEMHAKLRRALEHREFIVYYQPQISLADGALIGFEALVRWQDPQAGMISPASFIPVAEETGLIAPIGEWVLRTACAQARAWQDAGHPPVTMAVNLSPVQFRQPDLEQRIEAAISAAGLDPSWLELEITESAIMERGQESLQVLHRLKALGVRLSIDDFGTGYSSLSYLKLFPVDKLKIDQSFVRDIPDDLNDMEIASTIIAMAQHMRLKVLAEGVETEAQRNFLTVQGCHYFQGYLFARPLPAAECERLFASKRA